MAEHDAETIRMVVRERYAAAAADASCCDDAQVEMGMGLGVGPLRRRRNPRAVVGRARAPRLQQIRPRSRISHASGITAATANRTGLALSELAPLRL